MNNMSWLLKFSLFKKSTGSSNTTENTENTESAGI